MVRLNGKSQAIERLTRMIHRVEGAGNRLPARFLSTGWPPVDEALGLPGGGGLRLGAIHEFVGPLAAEDLREPDRLAAERSSAGPRRLVADRVANPPPMCLLVHLARQAAVEGAIVWVGRRCWPSPQFLARRGLLERSLFVDAAQPGDRLWAVELAARSSAVAAVIGDAERFSLPATRRLELAAREGSSLVLLSRPGWELAAASAATTRWAVYRRADNSMNPAWTLELFRCKNRQVPPARRWPMEWDCAKDAVIISAAVVDRLPSAQAPALRRSIG